MTYPHPLVRAELEHWSRTKVDVLVWREVAAALEVTAVPIAVLLAADGTVLARIANFVEPEDFARALRDVRRAE